MNRQVRRCGFVKLRGAVNAVSRDNRTTVCGSCSCIEQAIGSGGVDPRILREFGEAVDCVCKAAWVAQEWQQRQRKIGAGFPELEIHTPEILARKSKRDSNPKKSTILLTSCTNHARLSRLVKKAGQLQAVANPAVNLRSSKPP